MNTFKKILTLLLAICMIVSMLSLTACKKEPEKKDDEKTNPGGNVTPNTDKTYTVTIVDGDNNPVEGVKLTITDGKSFPVVTTDANGKASTSLPEGTVSVMITSLPDKYEKPDKVSGVYHGVFAKGSTELTIKVEEKTVEGNDYVVRVVDQDGNPVIGIEVQLCYNGICAAGVPTDEYGEISAKIDTDAKIDVKLYPLDGYTLPAANADGYHAAIEVGDTEIEITITKN